MQTKMKKHLTQVSHLHDLKVYFSLETVLGMCLEYISHGFIMLLSTSGGSSHGLKVKCKRQREDNVGGIRHQYI